MKRSDPGSAGGGPQAIATGGRRPWAAPLDPLIETELVRYLVRQAPTGFAIGILAIVAVVLVLRNAAPWNLLVTWVASIVVLSLPAFVVVWRFGRASDVTDGIARWRRALAVAYGLAGAGWGSAALLLYPHVTMPYQLFLLFIVGGSGVSGMVALAPVRMVFGAYLTASFVPMIAMLLAAGPLPTVATGMLSAVFWGTTIVLASHLRALMVRSLRLRFANLELIADLSIAKDEAVAASRTKSVLLANVSHELRTPLALILGPTRRLLAGGASSEEAHRTLETVERNAQALLKHVNDLLDVAKLEAGRMEIARARLDVVELVRRTASLFDALARERRVALTVETPQSLPLVGDEVKLERVVLNLLSNAMKFVPDGGHVRVAVVADGADVALAVEDDGPGVPIALREAIFERFRRGDDATTTRFGGTGLGLAIAREIVEHHGGRIEVGTGTHGGALFRVTLPRGAEAVVPAHDETAARGARTALEEVARQTVAELRLHDQATAATVGGSGRALVLVVEDNADMSRFLAECLAADHRVATARDGREALQQALALRPDVIVSDVMMPVMGGEALVRALRSHPELGGIPIIVLTAKADDALRVQLLREGAQDFLTKPFTPEELRARVDNLATLKRTRDVLQGALSSQSRDLTSLADQLAAANRAKDEFLAILSHELRTPLTPILSWAFLLRDGRLDAQAIQRGLRAIERNAKLQMRIIDDLLDVSRAIAGKLRLEVRPTALDPVIQSAVESLRPAAEAKGVRLETLLDPEVNLVSGDPERLQQVVWNLASNAVKFTPRGGLVSVRSARVGRHVRLTVSDTGIGIDAAALPRLFERFWQVDSSPTRTHGGLGLGLAVVRHLVELHGGTVHAESTGPGRGATFTVALPILAAAGDPGAPADRDDVAVTGPTLDGLKVLVVDDDEDTCDIVGAILEGAGAEVHTCLSANQALTTMETWAPDILVSDIAMPGEDGYTLLGRIRARRTGTGGRLPAVALSAYGGMEDRMRALSAGFQMHLAKPIEPDRLVSVVASVAGAAPH